MDRDASLKIRALLSLTFLLIGGGIVFYHFVEGMSWVNSFYFTVITLTTVGYGDIVPVTDIGKIFTAFYILCGVGVLVSFVSFSSGFLLHRQVEQIQSRTRREQEKMCK